jgi:hypothetical protein
MLLIAAPNLALDHVAPVPPNVHLAVTKPQSQWAGLLVAPAAASAVDTSQPAWWCYFSSDNASRKAAYSCVQHARSSLAGCCRQRRRRLVKAPTYAPHLVSGHTQQAAAQAVARPRRPACHSWRSTLPTLCCAPLHTSQLRPATITHMLPALASPAVKNDTPGPPERRWVHCPPDRLRCWCSSWPPSPAAPWRRAPCAARRTCAAAARRRRPVSRGGVGWGRKGPRSRHQQIGPGLGWGPRALHAARSHPGHPQAVLVLRGRLAALLGALQGAGPVRVALVAARHCAGCERVL